MKECIQKETNVNDQERDIFRCLCGIHNRDKKLKSWKQTGKRFKEK